MQIESALKSDMAYNVLKLIEDAAIAEIEIESVGQVHQIVIKLCGSENNNNYNASYIKAIFSE